MNAPKVTPADLELEIVSEHYILPGSTDHLVMAGPARPSGLSPEETNPASLSVLTICVLVLRNGLTVLGKSACVSPANFDSAVGRKIAREDAIEQLWPLLGFRLADKLAAG